MVSVCLCQSPLAPQSPEVLYWHWLTRLVPEKGSKVAEVDTFQVLIKNANSTCFIVLTACSCCTV